MKPSEIRKLNDALEDIEHKERNGDAARPLSVDAKMGLLEAHFAALVDELKGPLARFGLRQYIVLREAKLHPRRHPHPAQLTLALPGLEAVKVPAAIRIPYETKKGEPGRRHVGRWGKTLEVSISDFGLWIRHQEERLKTASAKQRQELDRQKKLYLAAKAVAKGDLRMSMGEALAKRMGKRKMRSLGFGVGWLFEGV